MFSRKDWAGMSEDQRLLSLQGMETQEAATQGRPAATVLKGVFNDRTHGIYDCYNNNIYINVEYLRSGQPDNAVETWGHETNHANDYYSGKDLSSIPDPEIDFEGYENHPQEMGCRQYGEAKLEQYNQNENKYHTGLYNSENKGITGFREKAAVSHDSTQHTQNKGIDSFRAKAAGNHESSHAPVSGEGQEISGNGAQPNGESSGQLM